MHGHVDNEKENFIVGMFVEAEIITDEIKRIGLPKTAIIDVEETSFALILEDQNDTEFQFKKIPLVLGKQTEDYAEILNTGDLKDQQILVNGTSMLLKGNEGGHSH